MCVHSQVKGMQEELTALEPELKKKSKETEELMQRLAVDQEKATQVRKLELSFHLSFLSFPLPLKLLTPSLSFLSV